MKYFAATILLLNIAFVSLFLIVTPTTQIDSKNYIERAQSAAQQLPSSNPEEKLHQEALLSNLNSINQINSDLITSSNYTGISLFIVSIVNCFSLGLISLSLWSRSKKTEQGAAANP